jgi:tetratricopeptide (TPR) repeat protein
MAWQALATARAAGDIRGQAAALTDLGILLDPKDTRVAPAFQAAIDTAVRLGDRPLQADAEGQYGVYLNKVGRPADGLAMLQRSHATAAASGDRHGEKAALERLGTALLASDSRRAQVHYYAALDLARSLGDVRHEAELLWLAAITHADLGERDRAVASAEAAIGRLQKLGHPQAAELSKHLDQYRGSSGPVALGGSVSFYSGTSTPGVTAMSSAPPPGPGLLRMAFTALKSAAKFVGSGLKTLPPETVRARLEVCGPCGHFSGTRCRVCGCFVSLKARLPHESCPVGKWPA